MEDGGDGRRGRRGAAAPTRFGAEVEGVNGWETDNRQPETDDRRRETGDRKPQPRNPPRPRLPPFPIPSSQFPAPPARSFGASPHAEP